MIVAPALLHRRPLAALALAALLSVVLTADAAADAPDAAEFDWSGWDAILTSYGEGPCFDYRGLADDAAAREAFMTAALALQDAFTAFEKARFPVIASMQGPCVGGGVDMITACDLRYATKEAWMRIEETNIGMMADVGTLQRLPRLIPEGVARELAYTGESLSPERAEALGLVNAVLEDEAALRAHVDQVAERIASKAPLTISGIKRSFLYARDHTVGDSLEHAMTLQASLWSPSDIMEAITARGEKREGAFEALKPVKRMGGDG